MTTLAVDMSRATPEPEHRPSEPLHLDAGAVLRLEWGSSAPLIVVCRGTVWATTTPADGDSVIRGGESLMPGGRGPVVVEALAPSDLLVVRRQGAAYVGSSASRVVSDSVKHAGRKIRQWLLDYSVRNASRGSIREARRAGR